MKYQSSTPDGDELSSGAARIQKVLSGALYTEYMAFVLCSSFAPISHSCIAKREKECLGQRKKIANNLSTMSRKHIGKR